MSQSQQKRISLQLLWILLFLLLISIAGGAEQEVLATTFPEKESPEAPSRYESCVECLGTHSPTTHQCFSCLGTDGTMSCHCDDHASLFLTGESDCIIAIRTTSGCGVSYLNNTLEALEEQRQASIAVGMLVTFATLIWAKTIWYRPKQTIDSSEMEILYDEPLLDHLEQQQEVGI